MFRLPCPELNICLALFFFLHAGYRSRSSRCSRLSIRWRSCSSLPLSKFRVRVLCLSTTKKRNLKAEKTAFPIVCRLDWTVDCDCAGELLSGAVAGLCLDSDLGHCCGYCSVSPSDVPWPRWANWNSKCLDSCVKRRPSLWVPLDGIGTTYQSQILTCIYLQFESSRLVMIQLLLQGLKVSLVAVSHGNNESCCCLAWEQ